MVSTGALSGVVLLGTAMPGPAPLTGAQSGLGSELREAMLAETKADKNSL